MSVTTKIKPIEGKKINVKAARRRQRAVQVWTQFRASKSGLAGLVILGLVILLALLAPVIFPAEMLDVTKLDNPQNQAPRPRTFWAPTRRAAPCWRCWCGVHGFR